MTNALNEDPMNVTLTTLLPLLAAKWTNLYFRTINTLLFSKDENELGTSIESLKKETRLDEYFTFGHGAHHLWICKRKPSDKKQNLSTLHHDDPLLTWSLCTYTDWS